MEGFGRIGRVGPKHTREDRMSIGRLGPTLPFLPKSSKNPSKILTQIKIGW
jgi:hypothetical protein